MSHWGCAGTQLKRQGNPRPNPCVESAQQDRPAATEHQERERVGKVRKKDSQMQGRDVSEPVPARPESVAQIFEKAERRRGLARVYSPDGGPHIDVSDQLCAAMNRAEDEGDEARAEALWIEYTDQLLWECRAQLHGTVADLGTVWPGRKYELAVLLLREIMEMLGEGQKRRPLDAEVRGLVYRRDGWQCVVCGEHEIHMLSVDHIVPVRLGGTNDLDNLRTLCRPCNSSKGARL